MHVHFRLKHKKENASIRSAASKPGATLLKHDKKNVQQGDEYEKQISGVLVMQEKIHNCQYHHMYCMRTKTCKIHLPFIHQLSCFGHNLKKNPTERGWEQGQTKEA